MTGVDDLPVTLALGDDTHGVTRFALEVARWTGARVARSADDLPTGSRVHLHVTDRVLGPDPVSAGRAAVALARRHELTVTLHDVPQRTDGDGFLRRVDCYRAVLGVAAGWVVSSHHERALVERWCHPRTPGHVVPLPVVPLEGAAVPPATGGPLSVGVFGFVYPGKGHAEALAAIAALPPSPTRGPVELRVLGAAAAGHAADLEALVRRGRDLGVPVRVTGRVPEPAVASALRDVTVPVVAHRNVSASGSQNSWIAAGRRPLVRDGVYAREMAALRPGTTTLFTDPDLGTAVATALADPASTWVAAGVPVGPGPAEVAVAYRRWWRDVAEEAA
ncbi:glycosyltransferase involved in cell wall biosynthesis [Nocardioides zeae]|uniref:Glycosyltransferase involved in cell wall biosynthesis n=1 Tax=Nocardioides zeae TaxID=1457234 RepID=A0ACC6ING4_9ACTN|nr:glycosyltransferase involved in cell wall biosynthesis [Nocardioides zeae]MDR6212234.1 glycosyltransferase involved in cell wall biosynthesis [Nocardioides zeae]